MAKTERFYSDAHQSWAVRYLEDDVDLGIAAGSEILIED